MELEKQERCLEDDCLAYLMALNCKQCGCHGLHGYCGFERLCPFVNEDRSLMTALDTPIVALTSIWKKTILQNRSRLYEIGKEQGRKEAEKELKAKEESNG